MCDLAGNVQEWVEDRWHHDYDGAPADGGPPRDHRALLPPLLGLLLAGCLDERVLPASSGPPDAGTADSGADAGRYLTPEHCGRCGNDCRDRFSVAAGTECRLLDGGPGCAITACPPGHRLVGDLACLPEASRLCEPCLDDDDCGAGAPLGPDCPDGFACDPDRTLCLPASGDCACGPGAHWSRACAAHRCPPEAARSTATDGGRGGTARCPLPADQGQRGEAGSAGGGAGGEGGYDQVLHYVHDDCWCGVSREPVAGQPGGPGRSGPAGNPGAGCQPELGTAADGLWQAAGGAPPGQGGRGGPGSGGGGGGVGAGVARDAWLPDECAGENEYLGGSGGGGGAGGCGGDGGGSGGPGGGSFGVFLVYDRPPASLPDLWDNRIERGAGGDGGPGGGGGGGCGGLSAGIWVSGHGPLATGALIEGNAFPHTGSGGRGGPGGESAAAPGRAGIDGLYVQVAP